MKKRKEDDKQAKMVRLYERTLHFGTLLTLISGRTISRPEWERSENEKKLCKALEEVAQQVGAKSIQAVAIAYVMQKTPYVFPIVGYRKIEQLHANIEALDVALSTEQIQFLESVLPFDLGFPHGMVVRTSLLHGMNMDAYSLSCVG